MAKTRPEIPTQLPVVVVRPLYAGVGATDRVVEVVRAAVADARKRAAAAQADVQETVSGLDYQPKALREQSVHRRKRLTRMVKLRRRVRCSLGIAVL